MEIVAVLALASDNRDMYKARRCSRSFSRPNSKAVRTITNLFFFSQLNPIRRAVPRCSPFLLSSVLHLRNIQLSHRAIFLSASYSTKPSFESDSPARMALGDFPKLPASQADLVKYIAQNPDKPMVEIMDPYRKFEAHLRSVFAQDRQNPILDDPFLNVVPLFTDDTKDITVRARDLASESEEEKSKYIMALPDDKRRPHGSPATVADLTEFQKNFNIFSESSLAELDWNNVVAAGSSVVNTLLPVPKEFNTNKRKLREYYHEKFCPASDVDLFLYGLTHEEAIEKIKQIEQSIRDSILSEVTVVRTKYAITIASQYPVRHVQVSITPLQMQIQSAFSFNWFPTGRSPCLQVHQRNLDRFRY